MAHQHTNSLLGSLSSGSRDLLLARCTEVSLARETVFYEPGETPRYGWFLTSGLASAVALTSAGQATSVRRMGNEGVVGSLHLLGPTRLPSRCLMLLPGTALRIGFPQLQQAFWSSTEIRARFLEFIQEQMAVLHQSAACHLHHGAKERLASCLLVMQARTQQEVLEVTQEVLAKMLGTRRSTVSLLAVELQSRGSIAYSRGQIRILNRRKLEAAACGCYPILQKLYRSLYRYQVPT